MEQGLAELRKIFIKKVDEVIEKAKSTNEIEASLPSVRVFITVHRILFECKIINNILHQVTCKTVSSINRWL